MPLLSSFNTEYNSLDVFVKDEGYADVRFISDKAKDWAAKNGIPYTVSDNKISSFKFATSGSVAIRLVKKMLKQGFDIVSEFN